MHRREIEALRGPKNVLDPWRPYGYFYEEEPGEDLEPVPTATILLTNRECPFRCVFCDLWKNTLDDRVPTGAIHHQMCGPLRELPPVRQVKLYNAGSFFDPEAIPPEEYPGIASLLESYERVIVECHPAFVGRRCFDFSNLLPGRLEVAMGLETANPDVLARLNKGMTLDSFQRAAHLLSENGIDLRVFILLKPPFMDGRDEEYLDWVFRSLDCAFDCGAKVCSVIPTRAGNGVMDRLAESGEFSPPRLQSLEAAVEHGLQTGRGRVFADLWEVERFYSCDCSAARSERLAAMNRTQRIPPSVSCEACA